MEILIYSVFKNNKQNFLGSFHIRYDCDNMALLNSKKSNNKKQRKGEKIIPRLMSAVQ